ncbi:phage terminase small subunit [Hahella sp. CR1]|uniref:phage terminase small subunit n=1 Tax=Hahella sp. CR1 TaxID=2992807 RepID=UPI002441A19C|nr:phage terminase small subunit [Hahella sp. CR1]MDG9666736.1 phage terminase small subunit [Hahella sp. CR1]
MPLLTVQHKQRRLARQAASDALTAAEMARNASVMHSALSPRVRGDYPVALAALTQCREQLAELDSIPDKVALKARVLPQFMDFLQAYRDSGQRYPNEVLVFCVIWLFDVGDIENALSWAGLAIEQQQCMPGHFKRDLPTYVLEEVHDWAERQFKGGDSASPYLDDAAAHLTSQAWPTANDIVAGKLYRQCGLNAEQNVDLNAALAYFEQAQAANPAAGCKTRIAKLQARLGLA